MVGIFFSTKLNIPQTQLGLPRLRSSLQNATTWLADRLYQLDRWIVFFPSSSLTNTTTISITMTTMIANTVALNITS